jgi:inhibitor of cysteine peptidase
MDRRRNRGMRRSKAAVMAAMGMLVAMVVTLTGCEITAKPPEFSDPGEPIVVDAGEEFAIVLESNPTTGYQWQISGDYDEKVVELEKSEFKRASDDRVGAGGKEVWTFKALEEGFTSLSFKYLRPWETEVEPAEALAFRVIVRKKGSEKEKFKEYNSSDEPIETPPGHEFIIVLESNPTTGYQWQLAEPLDETKLLLVSSEFRKKKGKATGSEQGEAVGVPGEELWTFLAVGEGETEITLEYLRPWERDTEPARSETFIVEIKAETAGD